MGQERASSAPAARAYGAWGATALLELAVTWAVTRTAEALPVGLAGAAAADLLCSIDGSALRARLLKATASASAKMRWSHSCVRIGIAVAATMRRSGCQVVAA
ncbi:hypothetical protein Xthr_16770 [Xanthomonas citri pv. thirumalacharii]|nr:hypothetical protein [Xanthomonas citri pv. thirumalacharii]